jgi:type I restriction enzyme S subunit
LKELAAWRAVRIGDLGRVVTGSTPGAADHDRFFGSLPFITPTDLEANRRTPHITRFVSDVARSQLSKRIVPPRSVCFTCIGATIGKACLTDAISLTNQQINTIVVDEHNYDPAFVYYRLVADREAIRVTASGAATPIISKSAFENVRVRTPPLSTQRKIAAILSAYDDLIENNNRRIKILEEMAQRIYREWFVDFRYPGHEDVSLVGTKLGQVPGGWEVESLFDVADVTFGFPFKSALFSTLDGRPVVRIRDIPAGESATLTTEAPSPTYEIETGDILVGMDGDFHMARWSSGRAWLNQRVARFRPKPRWRVGRYALYLALEAPIGRWNKTIVGTTVAHLGKSHLARTKLLVPPDSIAAMAKGVLEPIFDKEICLRQTSRVLRTTRDLLLPRLVSGEVDVTDLEIAVSELAT